MGQFREKHRIISYLIIHCPTSEGVSEVSERANQRAVRANECVVRANKRTDQQVALYVWILDYSGP